MGQTYCLLFRKVTGGTQDDDDSVILEFHGAVERWHISYALKVRWRKRENERTRK